MGLLANLKKLYGTQKVEIHHVFDDIYGYHLKHVADVYVDDKGEKDENFFNTTD